MSRALVLGAGVSGLAAARLARARGMAVTLYTEDPLPGPEALEWGVAAGDWDPELLSGIDLVITSPGFPERSAPIVHSLEWGLPVWSEVEFAYRNLDLPVVAITGTNGKTSVTEATASMLGASGLRTRAVGNIGAPLSDYVDVEADLLVVEVSSFQLRFCESFHPTTAGITNLAADHLDWHGSEFSYRSAKAKIFANQTEGDVLVYDADDEGASSLAEESPGPRYPVSITGVANAGGGLERDRLVVEDTSVAIGDLADQDPIHLSNTIMAMALARFSGATPPGIVEAAKSFRPGSHRRQVVLEEDGVVWINDSKATNLHAARASVRSHSRVILIAGGQAKGHDLTPLATEPAVKLLVGIGESGPLLVEAAGDRGLLAETLEEAVAIARRLSEPGDTVLLAPAGASFDQFKSYEERGMVFTELVRTGNGHA